MKTTAYIIFILTFFFSQFISNAKEDGWELVSMNPPRGNIIDLVNNDLNKLYSAGDGGIYKSDDLGDTWIKLDNEYTTDIVELNHTLFSRRILKTDTGYYWGFYKSIDNGNSWIEVKPNLVKDLSSFKLNLSNNNLTLFFKDKLSNVLIYSSSDNGNSWIDNGYLKQNDGIQSFSNCYKKDNVIVIIGQRMKNGDVLYISLDNGKSWFERNTKFSVYDIQIENDTTFYLATKDGIYYTTDSGETLFPKWLQNEMIIKILLKLNEKKLFAISYYNGLFFSSDLGKNWKISDEILNFNINQRRINDILSISDLTFVAPYNIGTYFSNKFWFDWEEKNNGFSGISPKDFIFNQNKFYMSCWGFFKTGDKGKTFDYMGLKQYATGPIAVNSKGDIFVGSAGGNLNKSTDDGITWEEINVTNIGAMEITKNDVIIISLRPDGIVRSTNNGLTWEAPPDVVGAFLATNDEGHIFSFSVGNIYRSTDEGLTWEKVADTDVDPTYIEFGGRIIFNNRTKTAAYYDLVTTDNGRNWVTQAGTGLSFVTTESAHYAVDSTYNWVYARDNYIIRSTDNGKTWYRMDTTGLKHKEFNTIGCSPDGHIYVFGATGGLYRSRDKFVSVKEEPRTKADIFNSPNPFSETTKIRFTLLNPGDVHLTVYDLLGNTIETKHYGLLETGENTILFDGEKYPSGIYFYRIEAGLITVSSSFMNLVK